MSLGLEIRKGGKSITEAKRKFGAGPGVGGTLVVSGLITQAEAREFRVQKAGK